MSYRMYGGPGSGSMIAEVAFEVAQVPVERVHVPWEQTGWESPVLSALNPLGQLPTVVMPDGRVLTETAAIVLHLADLAPGAGLVPAADHPRRAEFLRWLIFLVAAVYPTFTYGDVPKRWVDGDADAAKKLRHRTDEHRNQLWLHVEQHVGEPWWLGETWSALDAYVWMMTNWRPGRDWFAERCPRLHAIALRMDQHPACVAVEARNPR